MIKMLKTPRWRTSYKLLCLIILGLVIINLIAIPLISADLYFDNRKGDLQFGDGISE